MSFKRRGRWLLAATLALGAPSACGDDSATDLKDPPSGTGAAGGGGAGMPGPDAPTPVVWPTVRSDIPLDPGIEAAVAVLLGQMSIEQKVGQMVQAEIQSITPAEVKEYFVGSVLNGGGSWPGKSKTATASDWVALADAYYAASVDTSGGTPGQYLGIPVIWGTDAVHGHGNLRGATLFPHNIALGAAHDPDLIQQIGVATAKEVAVTGLDWAFAPTLAVVRDDRWGRTYEGYSEEPELVRSYAGRIVRGLQGDPMDSADLLSDAHILCTAKHFLGDGGTNLGKDQGDTLATEEQLRDLHAQGYLSALEAGAQTVMASFSSWQGQKMHGDQRFLTEILKGNFGFTGFVVGDWNGHGQVTGCDDTQCAAAIIAGVDMLMVPYDWKAFIQNTIAQVHNGDIPIARVDDAVTRILRVKMRAGLLGPKKTKGAPSTRALAGQTSLLGGASHRALARKAVRESLVLLKNKGNILPLEKSRHVLVAGRGADDISTQTGGWSLTWQGRENDNRDFPNAQSIYAGIDEVLTGAALGGTATLSPDGSGATPAYDAAIVVIGESPYAEGQGDISKFQTMEHAVMHPEDLAVINTIRAAAPELPIVTVLLSGRPLYVNKELNRSAAFVAAWLPGSEGGGVADLLFGDSDFQGKLAYSWPAADCQVPVNRGDGKTPLFAYGYGLTTADVDMLADDLPEVSSERGCDAPEPTGTGRTDQPLEIFVGGANKGDFVLRIGGPSNWSGVDVGVEAVLPGGEVTATSVDGRIQGSARQITWSGTGQVYSAVGQGSQDLSPYGSSETSLVLRVRVDSPPRGNVNLAMHCTYPCFGEIPISNQLIEIADGTWHDLSFPLKCFTNLGLDITAVSAPFLITTEAPMSLSIEDVRWLPSTAEPAPDCSIYRSLRREIIDQPVLSLYSDALSAGYSFAAFMNVADRQIDTGGDNYVWVGDLTPGSNIEIRKNGTAADLSAYDTANATLKFDLVITASSAPTAELLVKVGTNWPNLSDVRLFSEILGAQPALGVSTPVSIPIQTLIASENDLSPGYHVDISNVTDMIVFEAIDGDLSVQLDNIRWQQ